MLWVLPCFGDGAKAFEYAKWPFGFHENGGFSVTLPFRSKLLKNYFTVKTNAASEEPSSAADLWNVTFRSGHTNLRGNPSGKSCTLLNVSC